MHELKQTNEEHLLLSVAMGVNTLGSHKSCLLYLDTFWMAGKFY